ncbi:MAG: Uma2 family endonuclease [Candidatus Rokuibacteriota bacterium]|nr:MAG: Uma2 family endonuclease [Candidatus Rokubacteria bacterium]
MDTTVELKRRRFTLEEYHRMGEVGIFHENDRVELIEGEIVEMTPIGRVHAGTVDRIAQVFSRRLDDHVIVRVQNPIVFTRLVSESQPDVTLLVRRPDFYASGHPGPADILLVVEVMDEVWLVDLDSRRIEVYRRPTPEGYGQFHIVQPGESVAIGAFAEIQFAVTELLG